MDNKIDILFCITSYNRYDNVETLIKDLLIQDTKYTYQILLINDGSNDNRYGNFINYSEKLTYIYNEKNGGKNGYYKTVNKLWSLIPNYDCKYIIQSDDDFIICDNFINRLTDYFLNERSNNPKILALSPHLYSFNKYSDKEQSWTDTNGVDGIAIITHDVIKNLNYELTSPGNVSKPGNSVGTWQQISKSIRNLGGITKRTNYSLVYHNNTGGSVLHGDFRKHKMIFTQKFIGKLPQNIIDFDKNYAVKVDTNKKKNSEDISSGNKVVKKKSSEGTSSGNKVVKEEPKIQETPKPTKPVINTPIATEKPKINKQEIPEKMQKPKTINKTHGDLFMGKAMKKKLRFGKK
jgi:hypothetical protein